MPVQHVRLAEIMMQLRPDASPLFDYIVQQDADSPMPYLAKNYEPQPVTQAEVDDAA